MDAAGMCWRNRSRERQFGRLGHRHCSGPRMRQERDGAAHAALVHRLQVDHFAEDIEPPAEARHWSQDELTAFFESGGEACPLRCEALDVQVVRMPSGRRARAFLISDMHCDHAQNLEWMRDRLPPRKPGCFDVVVCCGDVSDNLDILRRVLVLLRSRFDEVLFTPGNHELWANTDPAGSTSLDRLDTIRQLCDACGARTEAIRVIGEPSSAESEPGGGGCDDVLFVPLLSWYHPSWDREPDLPGEDAAMNRLTPGMWTDHRRCRWPAALDSDEARAAHFAELNEPLVQALAAALPPSEGRAPPLVWDKRQTYAQYRETPMTDELWTSIEAESFFTPRGVEAGGEKCGVEERNGGVVREGYAVSEGGGIVDGVGGNEGRSSRERGRAGGAARGFGGPSDQSENDGGSEADDLPAGGGGEAPRSVAGAGTGHRAGGSDAAGNAEGIGGSDGAGASEGARNSLAAGDCGATGGRLSRRPFIISFSHFVPRQELLPEKRMLIIADLHKVSGSTHLEAQVRFISQFVHARVRCKRRKGLGWTQNIRIDTPLGAGAHVCTDLQKDRRTARS
jgi:hypothetical protein